MLKILAYGCTSAAGPSTSDYWNGLRAGKDHSTLIHSPHYSRICYWAQSQGHQNSLQKITSQLMQSWAQIKSNVDLSQKLGVIFASTKGCTEDFFSGETLPTSDPLTPILNEFLKCAELEVEDSVCVSNACSSTMAALFLAQQWILQKRVRQVLILSADQIGPFVNHGFFSLKALTQTKLKPFSDARDGLQLGEAASAIIVGESSSSDFAIKGLGIDTEGFAVARPSHSGESLFKACQAALKGETPELVVAHGTGTRANDEVEDQVFQKLFGSRQVPVTSTKWSIGHTLGASASMDIIAACEVLRTQSVFSIANTRTIDHQFKAHYLYGEKAVSGEKDMKSVSSVLVTSLGFGGVHGSVYLKRAY